MLGVLPDSVSGAWERLGGRVARSYQPPVAAGPDTQVALASRRRTLVKP